jgi:hypothetical protein
MVLMADKHTTYKGIPVRIAGPHGIMVNERRTLTDERYLEALKRIRALIASGNPLHGYDDTTVGAKNNECSWGFCQEHQAYWPDAEDHIWPDQFVEQGRVAPISKDKHHWCPLDSGLFGQFAHGHNQSATYGCFYRCAFFQRKGRKRPDREQVLARYDKAIAAIEQRIAQKEQETT